MPRQRTCSRSTNEQIETVGASDAHIYVRSLTESVCFYQIELLTEVSLRESREITVLRLEADELCEERQRLVGGAHCNGTSKGADDGNEAKYKIKHGHSFTDTTPAQGRRLRGLAMLAGSFHC